MQSLQPGVKHSQYCGDDSGLQEEAPCTPHTIVGSTVAAVESFRFQGTTISQNLKWDNHIDSIAEAVLFNLPQGLLKQYYPAITESVLCSSLTVWFGSIYQNRHQKTTTDSQDCWEDYRCPASKNFTTPEWGKWPRKSLWTPHTQPTLSLNCCSLAGATDYWALKQPDTRKVFSPLAVSHLNNTYHTPVLYICK